jgi:DNA-binding NarL/FixJ family response regulator
VTVRVVVADDQALVRSAFARLVDGEPDLEVVAEVDDGEQAVAATLDLRPDVVLMDVRMPVVDGLEATRRITADPRSADCRVLILTTFDLDEYVFRAIQAGASGFLIKDIEPERLLESIRVTAAGEAMLTPRATRLLIEHFVRPRRVPTGGMGLPDLTGREREVLRLIARGRSNQEIADELTISHATVKTHVARLLAKLDARDRTQLTVLAYETGEVAPGDE